MIEMVHFALRQSHLLQYIVAGNKIGNILIENVVIRKLLKEVVHKVLIFKCNRFSAAWILSANMTP